MPRTLAGFLTGMLLASSLVACADGEGPGISRPTRTPTQTPSIDIPTPTRSPSRTPSPSETQEPTPEPTSEPTEEPTDEPTPEVEPTDEPTPEVEPTDEPTPEVEPTDEPTLEVEPTDEPTLDEVEPTDEPTLEVEPTEEPTDETAEDDATDESDPTWLWWLLAALLLGAAVGIPLLVRCRRRAAWRSGSPRPRVSWLAGPRAPARPSPRRLPRAGRRRLGGRRAPGRRGRGPAHGAGVHRPDEAGRDRARDLRDASRLARERMDQLVAPGPHDTWALDLDTVMADLEAALGPPPASPPA